MYLYLYIISENITSPAILFVTTIMAPINNTLSPSTSPSRRSNTASVNIEHDASLPSHSVMTHITHSGKSRKRGVSAFASPNSPWARKRSLVSESMMSQEKHNVYENYSYEPGVPCFTMALKVSEGFSWNQDLFVSRYQQGLSGVDYEENLAPEVHDIVITDEDENIFPSD